MSANTSVSSRIAFTAPVPTVESRRSWVICVTAFAITAISFAAPAITVVGLRSIAEELGVERSVPALAYSLAWLGDDCGWTGRGAKWWPAEPAARYGLFVGLLGNSGINAPLYVYVTHWFDRRRGTALALLGSGSSVSAAIRARIFVVAEAHIGWRDTMLGFAALQFALVAPAAALTFTRAPEIAQPTGHRHGSKPEAQVLGLRPALVFGALCRAGFLCCVPMAMPQGHLVAFCGDMGIAPSEGAAMLSVLLGCARGGFCSSHVCAQGAKANPLTSVHPALARQPTFELRPLCNVLRVNTDSTGKQATGVTYIDARGNEVEQPASIVVLGAYCFSNTRLLLLSCIGTPYDPRTGKGVVGRNYAYQQGSSVHVFFDDREFNPFIGGGQLNTSIDELNGDVIDRGPLGFIGGAYVNTSARGAAPIKGKVVPPGTPRWGSDWKKAVAYNYRRNVAITSHGTCLSYRHNYLDLDPTYKDAYGLPLLRMTFDWNDNELRMMKYIDERCAEIGRAMNGSRLGGKTKGTHFGLVGYQSTHNVGGAVMGSDPSTSVVNKYLQSWDVSNLFVVGGSAFPQNPANGPTETIGMLACWAADAIKDNYVRRPGALV
jgi:choline dehydrogenase-like flavoprotein